MPIAFGSMPSRNLGGTASSTGNVSMPSGSGAGDLILIFVSLKPGSTVTIDTPADWNLGAVDYGGAGSESTADQGTTRVAVFWRILTGSTTGPNFTFSGGSSNVFYVRSHRFTKDPGETWATPLFSVGTDSTGSTTSYNATGGTVLDAAPADYVGYWTGYNGNAGSFVSRDFAIPGATLTSTVRVDNDNTSNGTDLRVDAATATIAGVGYGAPTFDSSWTANVANFGGTTVFYRLRLEGTTVVPVDGARSSSRATSPLLTQSQVLTPRAGSLARAGGSSATIDVPYPADVVADELLIIALPSRALDTDGAFSASGWTLIANQAGSFTRMNFLWRVATAADVGQSTVAVTGPDVLRAAKMLAVAGADTTGPIESHTVFTGSDSDANALVTMPSQTPSEHGSLLVWGGTGFQAPGCTWQPTKDQVVNSTNVTEWLDTWDESSNSSSEGRSGCAYYEAWTATATGNRGAEPSVAATSSGIFLVVKPLVEATAVDLLVDNARSASRAGSALLAQQSTLTVDPARSATRADDATLAQTSALVVDGARSASRAGSVLLTQNLGTLTVDNARSATRSTAPALAQQHALTVDSAAAATRTTAPTLTQQHAPLITDAARSATRAQSATLAQTHPLAIDAARSATRTTAPLLTQATDLTVDSARSTTRATAPLLDTTATLVVSDARAATRATAPLLGHTQTVTTSGARSATRATAPLLDSAVTLTVDGARAATRATAPTLTQSTPILTVDARSATRAGSPLLAQTSTLVVHDARAETRTTAPVLVISLTLTVDGARAETRATTTTLDQLALLVVSGARAPTRATTPRLALVNEGQAPPERTLTIGADPRTLTVGTEVRALLIPADPADAPPTFIVAADDRTLVVPADPRTLTT